MSACPVCSTSTLEPFGTGAWRCPTCTGAFVTDKALREKLTSLSRQAVIAGGSGKHDGPPRACPFCATEMGRAYVSRVPIDRCETHGTWFDAEELAAVLVQAANVETDARNAEDRARNRSGFGGLLDSIFSILIIL